MRVIAGTARSIPLQAPDGLATRPTQDRIKETLFNIIRDRVPGCRFLDLYAGSGQIGIEALSRGAKEACFVETSRKARGFIEQNLKKTHLDNDGFFRIIPGSALSFVSSGTAGRYDIIYMDPPFELHEENTVLSMIAEKKLLNDGGLVIVEAALDNGFHEKLPEMYSLVSLKDYKTSRHVFAEMR